jgi:hypothetical protein
MEPMPAKSGIELAPRSLSRFSPSRFIAGPVRGRSRLLVWASNTGITADCSVLFSGIPHWWWSEAEI